MSKLKEGQSFVEYAEDYVNKLEDREVMRLIAMSSHCQDEKQKKRVDHLLGHELTRIGYIPDQEDSDKPDPGFFTPDNPSSSPPGDDDPDEHDQAWREE